jgi:hypothetical protein
MATAFGSFIDVESSPSSSVAYAVPAAPHKAFPKDYHSVPLPRSPDDLDLENIQWGTGNGNHREPGRAATSGTQTPRTPNDLEMSRPGSPTGNELYGVDALQSFSNPPMNRFRMVAVSLLNFTSGLSDSAPGALIPYIEKYVSDHICNI